MQWRNAGAIGSIAILISAEKNRAKKSFVAMCRTLGNLTAPEIRELRAYEFVTGAKTVNEQVRRYYLKIKNNNSQIASNMINEMGTVANDIALTEENVRGICRKLHKYISGFLIYFQGKEYPDYEMGYYPSVTLTKLEQKSDGPIFPHVQLGGKTVGEFNIQFALNDLLFRIAESATELFLLEWEGDKIPRGVSINGKSIGWTQNGMVNSDRGENIGTYERLVEFGGESGRQQKMIVFAY